jgi:hypothetical protein
MLGMPATNELLALARIDEGHMIHDDYRFDAERPGGHRECT